MKKIFNFSCLALGMILLLAACDTRSTGAYKEKFTSSNFEQTVKKLADDNSVPTEDIAMLTNSLKRLSIYKDSIVGKTVGDLIKNEETYVRDYSKSQLLATANVAMVRVGTENKFIGIMPGKNQSGQDVNNLYFSFSNKMAKNLAALDGELVFYYRNNPQAQPTLLKAIPFNFRNEIAACTKDTLIFYEPFSENDNLAVLLRTQTSKISGYMNILQARSK